MIRIAEPMQGVALVKLSASEYGSIPTLEKTYDSVTWGEIIKINPEDKEKYGRLVGKYGHWRMYKDDLRIDSMPGIEKLCFIEIKDILGVTYETADSRNKS